MKKLISILTTFALILTTISFLQAEELTSGDVSPEPEQAYMYQLPTPEELPDAESGEDEYLPEEAIAEELLSDPYNLQRNERS